MSQELRPYQREAVAAIFARFAEQRSTLLVLPTGLGKTTVFTSVVKRWRDEGRGRALVIAHREELISQAADRLRSFGLDVAIEMGDQRASALFNPDVVVATVQTMSRANRREAFGPGAFGLIVIDECHRAVADSYRSIPAYFSSAKVLGVTATPDRAAMGTVFESIAYAVDIRDAIGQGYLAPIRQKAVHVEGLDLSRVRTTAGDLNEDELEQVLVEEENLHGIAHPTVELAGDRPTMVFAASVAHAHALAKVMDRRLTSMGRPDQVVALDGTTDRVARRDALRRFSEGKFQFLLNCALFTEGFDAPRISCVAMARPTKSRILYTQCLDAATEILTEDGWRGIDDDLGRVAAYDLATARVHWSAAEKVIRPLGDEAMWGIENPHLSLRVTAGHRMVYSRRVGRAHARTPWAFGRADDMPSEFRIPLAGTADVPDAPVSDADLSFMGLLLTDGNYNPQNNAITLFQSERHPEVIAHIEETLRACGFKFGHGVETAPTNFGERSPLHRWTISRGAPRGRDAHLSGWGRLSDWVSDDGKSLTSAYETLSPRQVGVLLAAMQMGNGTKHEPATWTKRTRDIVIANETLGSQLQSLLVRRAYRCSMAPTPSKAVMLHIGRDAEWSVVQTAADGRPTWCVVPSDPTERVWCVSVDTGAIIVRRNGKVAVVGNCVGRGTRLHPGKPDLLVLDFEGNAGKHSLVSALDILGGTDEEVRKKARQLIEEDPDLDIIEALDGANAAIAESHRKKVIAEARYRAVDVDPFAVLGVHASAGRWGGVPMTELQRDVLERAGVDTRTLDKGQASALIERVIQRQREGLCTFRQARVLVRNGMSPDVSFEEASRAIDDLRKGWSGRAARG